MTQSETVKEEEKTEKKENKIEEGKTYNLNEVMPKKEKEHKRPDEIND